MSKRKLNAEERERYRAYLSETCPPGAQVYTILRHVARSGMMRVVDLVVAIPATETQPAHLSSIGYNAAMLMGWRWDADRQGIVVTGVGMDVGFHVVYELGYRLHGDGYALKQEWLYTRGQA